MNECFYTNIIPFTDTDIEGSDNICHKGAITNTNFPQNILHQGQEGLSPIFSVIAWG